MMLACDARETSLQVSVQDWIDEHFPVGLLCVVTDDTDDLATGGFYIVDSQRSSPEERGARLQLCYGRPETASLPDPVARNAVCCASPVHSLIGAAMLHTG